jgi:hypothetical protein
MRYGLLPADHTEKNQLFYNNDHIIEVHYSKICQDLELKA